jgi:hypothetical protein
MTAYHPGSKDEKIIVEQAECDLLLHKPLPRLPDFKRIMEDLVAQRMRQ